MFKTIKWAWGLAYRLGYNNAVQQIESAARHHRMQGHITALREQYEECDATKDKDVYDPFAILSPPRLTSKEHRIVADELYKMVTDMQSSDSQSQDKVSSKAS